MESWSSEISNVKLNANNEKLYVRSIGFNDFNKQIIFFHDIGEYHQRYLEFAHHMAMKEIGVTFIDMRGHGLSSGTRGHTDSYETLITDYRKFWTQYEEKFKDKSIFTLGHGVGALLALTFMLDVPEVIGSILVNPTIKYNEEHNHSIEDFIANYTFLNKLRLSYNGLSKISSETNISKSFGHDPLVNNKLTVGMYSAINKMINELKRMSYFVTRPILLQIGLEDELVDIDKSRLFASSFDKNKIDVKTYSDIGHEVFNEIDRDNVFKDIYTWIDKNINR